MGNDSVKQELAKNATAMVPTSGTEIMTTAAAAQTKALVEARFVLAVRNPRNLEQVRSDLRKECSRPSFALEDIKGKGNSALYLRPVGGGKNAEGLGIRFAEVAVRCYKNLMCDSFTVQESDTERIKYCYVLDLENNESWGDTVHITKYVERKTLKEGEQPIKTRRNSRQELVYLIEASEDAMTTKEAALISKKMRTLVLRMIPGDLQDECIQIIKDTRLEEVAKDPDAESRKIIDGMTQLNVSVIMLEQYLGHPVSQCSPAEVVELQNLWRALRDGETTWAELMENAEDAREERKASTTSGKGNAAMKEKLATEGKKETATKVEKTEAPKDVCAGCGATDEPLKETPQGMLCKNCQPKPETKKEPATKTEAAAQPEGQGAVKGPPPWLKKKSASPAAAPAEETSQPAAAEKSLEEKVAQMKQEQTKPAAPATERKKSKNPAPKGHPMPEYIDRVGPEDAWTDDQYARALAAMKTIPPYDTDAKAKEGLANTVIQWTAISLDEINKECLEVIITVLENWKTKK